MPCPFVVLGSGCVHTTDLDSSLCIPRLLVLFAVIFPNTRPSTGVSASRTDRLYLHPVADMSKSTAAILTVLLLSVLVSATPGRRVLGREATTGNAVEHQRILEELEEVHQLRERMLQEGEHLFVQYQLQLRAACWQRQRCVSCHMPEKCICTLHEDPASACIHNIYQDIAYH